MTTKEHLNQPSLPPFSTKRERASAVWRLAGPILISNISVVMLGLVDTAILGHLKEPAYLAAAASGGWIIAAITFAFSFLRMSAVSLTSRALGAGNHEETLKVLIRTLTLAIILGFAIMAICMPLMGIFAHWMTPGLPVEPLARSYAQIRLINLPAAFIILAITGWSLGRLNARLPLLLTVLVNVLNLIFDFIFILGLGMNSDGAALAAVLAECITCVVGLFMIRRTLAQVSKQQLRKVLTDWQAYIPQLVMNRHLFVRTISLILVFCFFFAQGARLSVAVLAANVILMQLFFTAVMILDSVANAAEALCGNTLGARRLKDFYSVINYCLWWSLALAIGFVLVFGVGGMHIGRLFTNIEEVLLHLANFMPWLAIMPIIAVWSYLFDGVYVAAARSRLMQNIMLVSAIMIFMPAWYYSRDFAGHGIWFAFSLFSLARSVLMVYFYLRISRQQQWLTPEVKDDSTDLTTTTKG